MTISITSSLLLYLFTFSISVFFSWCLSRINTSVVFVGRANRVFERAIKILLVVLILAPVVLLFTLRINVGTDYFGYEYLYNYYASRGGTIESLFHAGKEIGYGIVNLVGYHLFHNYRGVLFISSLLVSIPALIGLIIFDKRNIAIGWSIYLLTLYPSSFNGTRQHIAVSFCLLAIVLLLYEQYVIAATLIVISYFFHALSIVTVIFPILMIYGRRSSINKLKILVPSILASGFFGGAILSSLARIPLIAYYYNKYLDTKGVVTFMHFVTHISFKIPLSIILIILSARLVYENRNNFALIVYTFFDYAFILASYYIRWAIRMQYYSMIAAPLIIMSIRYSLKGKPKERLLVMSSLLFTYILRFLIIFGYSRYDGIVPYSFIIN